MSGHAATALVTRRIEDSPEPHPANRLGIAIPPSQRKSPFSLDGYLSWTSPKRTSKEAKVSEFRQAWIDALRNDISEVMGLLVTTYEVDSVTNNELLYKANRSISALRARISLRLNMGEDESKDLIAALDHLHEVANDTVPPPGLTDSARLAHPKGKMKPLRDATEVITKASQILLKKEWNRVKEGEAVYRRTQTYAWIVFVVLLLVAATAIIKCFCFAMIFPAAISSLS